MQKVTLPARVSQQGDGYQAAIDNLTFVGVGDTIEKAQDDLVEKFRSWVQTCEGQGTLEVSLSEAGYVQVDEDTELELQFVE